MNAIPHTALRTGASTWHRKLLGGAGHAMLIFSFCLFLRRSLMRTSGAWLGKCRGSACQKQPRCPISGPQNSPPQLVPRLHDDSLEPPAPRPQPCPVAAGGRAVQRALDLVPELGGTGGGTGLPGRAAGWPLASPTAEQPPDSLPQAVRRHGPAGGNQQQEAPGGLIGPGCGWG